MRKLPPTMSSFAVCFCLLLPARGSAASRTLKAGDVLGVGEDIVLTGDDVLEIEGTAQKPCRLDGNATQVRTADGWRGRVLVRYCEFRGLGSASKPALDLTAAGDGDQIVIEDSSFHACGAVHLTNQGTSATIFRRNTLLASSMVPVTNLPSESPPGFVAAGGSSARKLFQGNRVARSVVLFENTGNWLIGGDKDDDANIIIGMRASLSLHRCEEMTVRGNYIHTDIPSSRWSQVHTLEVVSSCPGLVVEHNVLRHGQWVVRGLAGEFRYNLVLDADGHNFIIGPKAGTHIHHNIFARYCTVDPNLGAMISVIYKGTDVQIYNNTFDGGGKDLARPWSVPAIAVGPDGFLASLRNNAFFNLPTNFFNGTATVRPEFAEKITSPAPARLGYADYNLFFNPDAHERAQHYAAQAGGENREPHDVLVSRPP